MNKSNKSQTTIEENVQVKSHAVAEFIKDRKSQDWQHFTKSDELKVSFDSKKACIKLSGERTFVQPAVTFLKSLADGLYTDTLIIKKAGAKKYFMEKGKMMLSMFARENGFVAVLQEDDMLEEEKDDIFQGTHADYTKIQIIKTIKPDVLSVLCKKKQTYLCCFIFRVNE